MRTNRRLIAVTALIGSLTLGSGLARAGDDERSACRGLPSHAALRSALEAAQAQSNGGFGLQMWATVVNRDGVVCAVAFTGDDRGDQWPGSRVISAQKANTANAFSLPGLALSTANIYSAVQPGGSLFGLQASNPVNALYNASGKLVGGIGVSGDSSCADHNIAWRARSTLNLDHVPAGVSPDATRKDNIVYDITPQPGQMPGVSASGWGHPVCSDAAKTIADNLPVTH